MIGHRTDRVSVTKQLATAEEPIWGPVWCRERGTSAANAALQAQKSCLTIETLQKKGAKSTGSHQMLQIHTNSDLHDVRIIS